MLRTTENELEAVKLRSLTPKQEAFCQALMVSATRGDAYFSAFNSKNRLTAQNGASELLAMAHIKARVKELRNMAAAENVLGRTEALNILSDIARSQASDLIGPDGEVSIAGARKLGKARALFGYSVKDTPNGKKIDVKMISAAQAIERISKIQGWDAPEVAMVEQVTFAINLGGAGVLPAGAGGSAGSAGSAGSDKDLLVSNDAPESAAQRSWEGEGGIGLSEELPPSDEGA